MKPFNLEEAKAGKMLVTRDGRDAKFIAHVPDCANGFRLICHVQGSDCTDDYQDNGNKYFGIRECISDLFMKTVRKTVYVNIWHGKSGLECSSQAHDTSQSATNAARLFEGGHYLAIGVPVEIEE